MAFQPDPQTPAPPWGPISTIAWALAAFFLSLLATAVVSFGMYRTGVLPESTSLSDEKWMTFLVFTSVPIEIAILVFASHLRRWPPTIYLGLVWPRRYQVIVAVLAVIAVTLALFTFNVFVLGAGRGYTPSTEVTQWRSAADTGWLIWFLAADIVAAPIGEEVMFRGFLFRGLARSGWEVPAIGATALVWALMHTQYNWVVVSELFLEGLMLGWFRWASGSTVLVIGTHMLMNALATLETWIRAEVFS